MIKKYEIIMDGSKKRIKALRSFHVQGRYVNIGDVGGIVYDENTLSQEGNGWIFSGNLNYPSIRVSGDSIVDTNGYEADVTDPRPFVNITGASALIGAHDFVTGALVARELAVADVEQGSINVALGTAYEESKVNNANVIRLKSLIYTGKSAGNITVSGEGYEVRAMRYDSNKRLIISSSWGATAAISGADYIAILIRKTSDAAIVPADITAANVTLPSVAIESYLDINDSRIEFQYTGAMTVATKVNPSSKSSTAAGLKSSVSASTLTINKSGGGNGIMWVFADIDHCNVTVSKLTTLSIITGTFKNVKRLLLDGTFAWGDPSAAVRAAFNFTDCDTVAYTNRTIPTTTITTAVSANTPLIFTRCNVPNGIFYHNAQAKNIYTDIDFAKASVDLGKTISGTGYLLVSSEVEGMYRIYDTVSKTFGCLVEAYDSVAGLTSMGANSYNTTIYKDAYIRGKFEIAGTNVFGNKVPGHTRAQVLNVQPRAVQGDFNASVVGQIVTGIVQSPSRVSMPTPVRANGATGFKIDNIPNGVNVSFVFVNPANNAITVATGWSVTPGSITVSASYLKETTAFLRFRKTGDAAITPEDLAGITVTVYNGCKIINTGKTAVNMKGSIRVEDNAALINASVTGSGYFGGNSVVYYNPAVWASLDFVGTVYMKDKAVFAPTALTGACALVHMEGNAKFIGSVATPSTNLSFIMRDNAVIEGKANTRSGVVMSGNSKVAATGQIMAASRGVLVMKDNASIEANTTVIGAITLAGNYKGNVVKTWTGKRTITDVNAPEYDDNVKTEYDF
jgi:hypothetical protein